MQYITNTKIERVIDKRLFRNILNYTRWTKGDKLSLTECKDLFEFLELEWVQTEERLYDLKEFGLVY